MPSKRFTVKVDGEPFSFDWDESRGPLTQRAVRDLYSQSRTKTVAPTTPAPTPSDKSVFESVGDSVKSGWDWANKSFLPNLGQDSITGNDALDRAARWGYSRIVQPAASPLGLATMPLASLKAGRIALAGLGTLAGGYGLTQTVPEAIENPSAENIADVGLSAVGAASIPIGMRSGAFGKPAPPPINDVPMSSWKALPSMYDRAKPGLTLDMPIVEPPGDVNFKMPLNPAKENVRPSSYQPLSPLDYGVQANRIDPGSGLSVPERLMGPSTNQRVMDSLLPARTRELIGGVKKGVNVNDSLIPYEAIGNAKTPILDQVKSDPNFVVKKAAESGVPELKKAAEQVAATKSRTMKNSTYDQIAKSGTAILESMGDAGKQLSTLLKRTRGEGAIDAGTLSAKIRSTVDKLSDADWKNTVDALEGRAPANSTEVANAVSQIRNVLDELGTLGETSGMEMSNPQGKIFPFKKMAENYFPRIWEKGKFNKDNIYNQLIAAGHSAEEADFIMKNAIEGGERLIGPQHMRVANLEGYRTDKGALYKHIDDMAKRAAEARLLGARDIASPDSPISQLIAKTSDPEQAATIVKQQLGRVPHDSLLQDAIHKINTFEATVKLPFFAISNMTQTAAPLMRSNVSSFVKGVKNMFTDKQFAEQSGAIQQVLRSSFNEMGGENAVSKMYGMSKTEGFLRSLSANAGKMEAERAFTALKKNPSDKVARSRLSDLLLDDVDTILKQDGLDERQLKMAGFRMSEITQGLTDPMDLPPAWSASPWMKLPTMLKRFAFQQTKIVRDAMKENPTRTSAIIATLYPIVGEAIGDTKTAAGALISGEDVGDKIAQRSEGLTGNKMVDRYARNISDAFAFGILTDMMGSLTGQFPGQGTDWMVGPALSDAAKMMAAGGKAVKQRSAEPLVSETIKKAPLGTYIDKRRKGGKETKAAWRPSLPKID